MFTQKAGNAGPTPELLVEIHPSHEFLEDR